MDRPRYRETEFSQLIITIGLVLLLIACAIGLYKIGVFDDQELWFTPFVICAAMVLGIIFQPQIGNQLKKLKKNGTPGP